MKIYTSRWSYDIPHEYRAIGISVGVPKWQLSYGYAEYDPLKPYGLFKKYSGEEFKAKYFEVLDKLGVDRIRFELELLSEQSGYKDIVLLCWENVLQGKSCHRRYFAEWWEANTGEAVEELEVALGTSKKEIPMPEQLDFFYAFNL